MVSQHLLPSFGADAGHAPRAVDLAWLLRRTGHPSLFWAATTTRAWQGWIRPLRELRVARGDVLLVHQVGQDAPMTDWLLHPGAKGVVLHGLGADGEAERRK